jgi:CBS domain containing-hemolysin-like protein
MAWVCFSISNIVVFLPRKLTFHELMSFLLVMLYTLAAILSNKNNNKMQKIVSNKSNASNLKLNVIANTIFATVLFLFKVMSNVSIATTFVFLGILAGKELALMFSEGGASRIAYKKTLFGIIVDIKKCVIGVIVSLCFVGFIGFLNIL